MGLDFISAAYIVGEWMHVPLIGRDLLSAWL
jgi:hypothetical protein